MSRPNLRDVSDRQQLRPVDGILPPIDLEAEAIVISDALNRHTLDEARTIVDASDFYSPDNRRIWQALVDLADEGEPVETARALELLVSRGFGAVDIGRYLSQLELCTEATIDVGAHARRVREQAWKRRLIARFDVAKRELYQPDQGLDAWLDEARPLLEADLDEARSHVDAPQMHDLMQARFADAMRDPADRLEKPGLRLGIDALDCEIVGGLQGLTMVTAARGGGKSTLLACAMVNMFRDNARASDGGALEAGLLFSYEMTGAEYSDLFAANLSGVSLTRIREKSMSDGERTRWAGAVEFEQAARYAITVHDDKARKTMTFVRSMARAAAQQCKRRGMRLRVLGVDNIQLLRPAPTKNARGYQSKEEEIDAVAEQLKELASEIDVPVIALSQINAQGQARGSRQIEAHADNVLRLKATKKRGGFGDACEATITIEKQRRGPFPLSVPLWFHPALARFEG